MQSALENTRKSTVTPAACLLASRLREELEALAAEISSFESGLKEPRTIRDFVHPESLLFALRHALEHKEALLAEYENHVRAHGC